MESKISTGSSVIDSFLKGGYESDIITTVYGPAGAGKTNLSILLAIQIASKGKKVIFIDTEGGFSIERLKQLSEDYQTILPKLIFLKPTSFQEQQKAFEKLREIVDDSIGTIIVDSIAMLYRLEMGKSNDIFDVNKELGRQIAYLTEIARKKKIPIFITNQVYSNFDERNRISMVGGDILKYGSKCLIELQNAKVGRRRAVLKKHRSLPSEKFVDFVIEEKGLVGFNSDEFEKV